MIFFGPRVAQNRRGWPMSSSDDDEFSSSEEEEEELIKKELPSRSTRGSRISKLVGEEAEADEAFWGQDAWNADDEDDEYSTEEGSVDSQYGRDMRVNKREIYRRRRCCGCRL